MNRFPAIEDLVPHGLPMRMLERLVAFEPGRATCTMLVRPSTPFVRQGRLSSVCTLEIMAQAVAACLGYEAFLNGDGIRVGMIVGVRKMELFAPTIAVGAELVVRVIRANGTDEVSTFEGQTFVEETSVSQAVMTLFHAEKPPE